jgi:DNA (cytosine-5)-methyltransferase 1
MRPRLLDLFCGAGGAAVGYHRAGFDVIGVDIRPQPHYPFPFIQADAMTFPLDGYDAIHASPPCQAYSTQGNRSRLEHPDLLPAVLERLGKLRIPWVVENVPGATRLMPNRFVLSGAMFGLGVHRPRCFVSNVLVLAPYRMAPPADGIGVYGKLDGRKLYGRRASGGNYHAARTLEQASAAMGIDWMEWDELREAIPPAYTEHVGQQLLAYIEAAV